MKIFLIVTIQTFRLNRGASKGGARWSKLLSQALNFTTKDLFKNVFGLSCWFLFKNLPRPWKIFRFTIATEHIIMISHFMMLADLNSIKEGIVVYSMSELECPCHGVIRLKAYGGCFWLCFMKLQKLSVIRYTFPRWSLPQLKHERSFCQKS